MLLVVPSLPHLARLELHTTLPITGKGLKNVEPSVADANMPIRTIYAYDVSPDGTKVTAKRPFYLAQSWIPDGLKVAR